MSRDYLAVADIVHIHAVLLHKYGGKGGIRDMGGLEAAVFRPQSGYYTGIVQEACALLESILVNHPFVDGNKRTAFAASDTFLRINGARINASSSTLHELILGWIQLPQAERWAKMVASFTRIVVLA